MIPHKLELIFILTSLAGLDPGASYCTKSRFYELRNTKSSGAVLYNAGRATVEQCVRVCRMAFQCQAFNMHWDNDTLTRTEGDCLPLTGDSVHNLEKQEGMSYFCKWLHYSV